MKVFLSFILLMLAGTSPLLAQKSIDTALKKWNKGTVPYTYADTLAHHKNHIVLIDTRAKEEFQVSHLKEAFWTGYKEFEKDSVLARITDKNTPIVVYCSIGVRSEDIGEKLMALGYSDVKNLYGGIFEWVNKGYPVYDSKEEETNKVHAFNKHWGELLQKGERVYGDKDLSTTNHK
ncbi:MAG: rhodanese-like domain-containing protein [Flavobacteriales bacterium]|nr:MAG: rhodanese-like domain-containing protein [Flavobacteriales bacterium]